MKKVFVAVTAIVLAISSFGFTDHKAAAKKASCCDGGACCYAGSACCKSK